MCNLDEQFNLLIYYMANACVCKAIYIYIYIYNIYIYIYIYIYIQIYHMTVYESVLSICMYTDQVIYTMYMY